MSELIINLLALWAFFIIGNQFINWYRNSVKGNSRTERAASAARLFEQALLKGGETADRAVLGAAHVSRQAIGGVHSKVSELKAGASQLLPEDIEWENDRANQSITLTIYVRGTFLSLHADKKGMTAMVTNRINGKTRRLKDAKELEGLIRHLSKEKSLSAEQLLAVQRFLKGAKSYTGK